MLLLTALFKVSQPIKHYKTHVKDKSYIGSTGVESRNVYDFEA
jgi:hypothetical protein